MTAELFQSVQACRWCLLVPATTKRQATDCCASCASLSPRDRVARWLTTIRERNGR